jgi:hypothetical protein
LPGPVADRRDELLVLLVRVVALAREHGERSEPRAGGRGGEAAALSM